jgi:broad specificity phosphatase PhoE
VPTELVFETHSWSEDNESGHASGWNHGRLSERGRLAAAELGARRRADGIAVAFSSDLRRAVETAEIAFAGTDVPVLHDWRLRECNYGSLNGAPAAEVHGDRMRYLDSPYPGGESWREATSRLASFVEDVRTRWDGQRCLVIGHVATRWGLEHYLNGRTIESLVAEEFTWREGWEYRL